MHPADWIALVALVLGGGGISAGGVSITAKITRLVAAVEQAAKDISTIITDVKAIGLTGQTHETRLTLAESRITALEAQHAAQQAVQAAKP